MRFVYTLERHVNEHRLLGVAILGWLVTEELPDGRLVTLAPNGHVSVKYPKGTELVADSYMEAARAAEEVWGAEQNRLAALARQRKAV